MASRMLFVLLCTLYVHWSIVLRICTCRMYVSDHFVVAGEPSIMKENSLGWNICTDKAGRQFVVSEDSDEEMVDEMDEGFVDESAVD